MDQDMFQSLASPSEVHNKLRVELSCNYLHPKCEDGRIFKRFKGHCRLHLDNVERCFDKVEDILDALEKYGKFGAGNYDFIRKMMYDVDQRVIKVIEAAERRIGKITGTRQKMNLNENGIEQPGIANERRILLLGMTGAGKSSTGNRLLKKKEFVAKASDRSVTIETKLGQAIRDGKNYMEVDTPGLFDTKTSNDETIAEIMKCYGLTSPGLHAILLVQEIGRMTDEQRAAIEIFEERFGKDLNNFLIVVFTGKHKLEGQSIEDYVSGLNPGSNLSDLLKRIDNRFVAFGIDSKDEDEVKDLLALIETVIEGNGGKCYTNEMYRQAEEILNARLEDARQREQERLDKENEDLLRATNEEHEKTQNELQFKLQEKEREPEMERERSSDNGIMDKISRYYDTFYQILTLSRLTKDLFR